MFLELCYSAIELLITWIPGGIGRRLRYTHFKRRLKYLGNGVVIDVGVRIINPQHVSIGDNTWIDNYVIILAGAPIGDRRVYRRPNPAFQYEEGQVVIGKNCHIANFCILQGHGGISIGDNSGVASGSLLYSMSHHYKDPLDPANGTIFKFSPLAPHCEQSLILSPIVMADNTALGLHSIVLPGTTIHEGSWVGVNSVVSKTIPAYCIASGNPAVVKKARFS